MYEWITAPGVRSWIAMAATHPSPYIHNPHTQTSAPCEQLIAASQPKGAVSPLWLCHEMPLEKPSLQSRHISGPQHSRHTQFSLPFSFTHSHNAWTNSKGLIYDNIWMVKPQDFIIKPRVNMLFFQCASIFLIDVRASQFFWLLHLLSPKTHCTQCMYITN